MKLAQLLGAVIIGTALWSCSGADSGSKNEQKAITTDSFLGKWRYQKVTKAKRIIKSVSNMDTLSISSDGTFYYYLREEQIYATGKWAFLDTAVQFIYDVVPSGAGVHEMIAAGDSTIFYLKDKRKTKFVVHNNLEKESIVRTYGLSFPSKNKMVFRENDLRFAFKR